MKIGIYSRALNKSFLSVVQGIIDRFVENEIQIQLFSKLSTQLRNNNGLFNGIEIFKSHNDIDPELDMMISIGGDGTFLESVTFVREREIPILGVNSGRLGFLADIAPEEIQAALSEVLNGNYDVEDRSLISMKCSHSIDQDFSFALNDFTIRKSDRATLIKIHSWVNGEYLNSYWADGLIVSTPTGSTAYSMSVGGPIVVPESNNFIVSPIASHNLTVRPLVINANHEIKLQVESPTKKHIASLDARSFYFEKDNTFILKKANFNVKVVKINGHSYFNTIRNKLMWGIDKRN